MAPNDSLFRDASRFAAVLRAHYRTLIRFASVFAMLATVYALLAPRWYESAVTLMPAASTADAGLLGAASALMGSAGGIDLPGGPTADSDKIDSVLRSRSVTDAVIVKFDLLTRYKPFRWSKPSMEKTRDK